MLSKKQDRPGARTATDIERKYNFGESVTAGYVQTTVKDAVAVATNEFKGYVADIDRNIVAQTEAITALEQADSDIKSELTEVKQSAADNARAIGEAAQAIAVVEESVEKLDGRIQENSGAINQNAEAIDQIEKSIEAIKGDVNQFDTSVGDIEDSVAQLEDSLEQTDGAVANLRTELDSTTSTANRAAMEVGGVINDINDHFAFVEGGTTIKGGIIPMVLPQGTDLDGVTIPNKYTSGNVAEYQYLHCPISTGTFSLDVESCGDQGQLLQRLTYSHKTNGKTYERVFYTDGWGAWVLVTDYTEAALKAIQADVNALEESLTNHKTESAAQMQETEGDINALGTEVNALRSETQALSGNVQALSSDLQGVINDVNDHFDFNEGGLTIKGGINPALIPAGTDLDELLVPNKYIGGTVTEYNYVNCPVPSGTFLLDVESCGDKGQLKQTLSYCNKTLGRVYERYFYSSAWGAWFCVTDFNPVVPETSKLLWNEGVYYMTATQTVNLPEAVSAQKHGIILAFSEYSGGALDSAFHCFFVPKTQVATHPGGEYVFTLATSNFAYMGTKRVLIYDNKIEGHADNNQTGTGGSGVKYTNNRFALRYVFGC